MSLVQGYSSDEDDGPAVQGGDVFGLGNIPAAKKMRVDEPMSVQLKPQAAPHVLAEVRAQFSLLHYNCTEYAWSYRRVIAGTCNSHIGDRCRRLSGHASILSVLSCRGALIQTR